MEQDYINPSKLLLALIDSIEEPVCLLDDNGNVLLNQNAKDLKKSGFDIDKVSKQATKNRTKTVSHQGVKYSLEKKDINHGTNSCLCKLVLEDDTIVRLTESSKKLKKVISAL